MRFTEDRDVFDRTMGAHLRQLSDFAQPYTGSLSKKHIEEFLHNAIEAAWADRHKFNPHRGSLLQFWGKCLRIAALSRPTWQVRTFDGWKVVKGSELGRS